jgi:hypothetical protein
MITPILMLLRGAVSDALSIQAAFVLSAVGFTLAAVAGFYLPIAVPGSNRLES